jgi:hypothetical protein
VCTFRHGREEDEVMGVSFQKELVVDRVQVFPAATDKEKTKMQVQLTVKIVTDSPIKRPPIKMNKESIP